MELGEAEMKSFIPYLHGKTWKTRSVTPSDLRKGTRSTTDKSQITHFNSFFDEILSNQTTHFSLAERKLVFYCFRDISVAIARVLPR